MTQTFSVNQNNDIFIGRDGNLAIVRDLEAVLQNCEHAAKTVRGEMVLAIDQGIPDFEVVWNGAPNVIQFEAALRQALLAVEGVTAVISLSVIQQGDVLSYEAEISTVFGVGGISG